MSEVNKINGKTDNLGCLGAFSAHFESMGYGQIDNPFGHKKSRPGGNRGGIVQ